MTRTFTVPILLPADPVEALQAATKQYVDASSGGVGNNVAYNYNATTTAPPASGQVRLNNATQTAATTLWAHNLTSDGLDVSVGFARISAGYQIYFQDADNSANWRLYNVTATPTDSGVYWTVPVTYHSGSVSVVPAGAAQLQTISPASHGIPPGGADGDVLTKTSSSDYAVDWEDPGGPFAPLERSISTTAPLTGGGNLSVDLTLDIDLFTELVHGTVSAPGTVDGKVLLDDNFWYHLIVAVDDGDWPPASPNANTLYLHLAP